MQIESLMGQFAILVGRTLARRWLRQRNLSPTKRQDTDRSGQEFPKKSEKTAGCGEQAPRPD